MTRLGGAYEVSNNFSCNWPVGGSGVVDRGTQSSWAQEESVSVAHSLSRTEFDEKFQSNRNLTVEDFAVFPLEMRGYLLAFQVGGGDQFSAYSVQMRPRTFLVVVNRADVSGHVSKAVLVPRLGRTLSPEEGIKWQPLYLPSLQKRESG